MLDFFIPAAYAQDAGGPGGGGIAQIIMLVGFVLIFYFLLWRPQSKRAKEHKKLVTNLSKGDEIVVGGGLLGRITEVFDDKDFISVEIAEGTVVSVQKSAVASVLPKGTLKSL